MLKIVFATPLLCNQWMDAVLGAAYHLPYPLPAYHSPLLCAYQVPNMLVDKERSGCPIME